MRGKGRPQAGCNSASTMSRCRTIHMRKTATLVPECTRPGGPAKLDPNTPPTASTSASPVNSAVARLQARESSLPKRTSGSLLTEGVLGALRRVVHPHPREIDKPDGHRDTKWALDAQLAFMAHPGPDPLWGSCGVGVALLGLLQGRMWSNAPSPTGGSDYSTTPCLAATRRRGATGDLRRIVGMSTPVPCGGPPGQLSVVMPPRLKTADDLLRGSRSSCRCWHRPADR